MRGIQPGGLLGTRISLAEIFWWTAVLMFGMGAYSRAQTAAEYAGAVSTMGSAGTSIQPADTTVFAPATNTKGKKSSANRHLPATIGDAGEDVNRKDLEDRAGEDAGKLLLRSTPTNAVVWIDGKRIGSTPLLLMLAPGAYQVEFRGQRMETAEKQVDLQPRETRTVLVPLKQRYPSHVKLQ